VVLGTISSLSTDVIIIIENKGTGRKSYVSTQSSDTGVVTLVTLGLGLMANQSYEISVVLKTATALCNREILTIGTSTTSCVTVLFENVLGNGGCQVSFESQTLTVPENTQPGTNCLCVTQAMLDALGRPYKIYTALLTQQPIVEGPLEIGVEYRITSYSPGDDFLNVGALANATGEVFVATGTTPTSYTNFSTLTTNKAPAVTVLENTIGNIVWNCPAQSIYNATLAGAFPETKTWVILSKTSNTNQFVYRSDDNTITVQTSKAVIGSGINPGDDIFWFGLDGELFFNSIEIRVYN